MLPWLSLSLPLSLALFLSLSLSTGLLVQGVFEYGGQSYDLVPHPEGASAAACARLVKLVLKQNEPCGAEQVLPPALSIFPTHPL